MPDSSSPPPTNKMFKDFVQIGIVVSDIEKTTRNLTEVFGIGPFRIIDWPPADRDNIERYYHGESSDFTARMAFTELGPIEMEIIQPLKGESIWTDFLREHGEGIHHLRFNVEDINPVQEHLARYGVLSIQHGTGIRSNTMWMNFGTENLLGFIIEIMKIAPGTNGRTPMIRDGKVIE